MKKADLIQKAELDFTREVDGLSIDATIEDVKLFMSLPLKIETSNRGECLISKKGDKFKVKIVNTDRKESVLFARCKHNSSYRVNSAIPEYNISLMKIINVYRRVWLKEIVKEEYMPCERCGGTGNMPFIYASGVCFRCEGDGIDPKMIKI